VASLATTLLGLEGNARRGDELRAKLWHGTRTLLDHLEKLGVATSNASDFPLRDHGPLPGGPREEVGFRLQLTAAHTAEQVDHLITVLGESTTASGSADPTRDGQLTSAMTSSGMSKLA
jgi:8-amino-7-oxononanoate synthase